MIFSTFEFILLFFPFTFGAYFYAAKYLGKDAAKLVLVLASFVFYWYGTGWFFLGFAASVFFNYAMGLLLGRVSKSWGKGRRRLLLTFGILANVGFLGYYKYTDFLIENINLVAGTDWALQHIILPIGISFFTFQLIAYLVDSYRGQTTDYHVLDYLLFITFFPQLVVGPIVHHKDVVPQFEDPKNAKLNFDNIALGIFIFAIGMAKKILLADPLTGFAQQSFLNPESMNFVSSWIHSISFTISYYFDLSGYADMAIGIGLCFNILLPENFDSPYKARNFADYWRRWHVTLSKFLGDYIFRSVYKTGGGTFRFYAAVFVTFLVSGFWHGAGWNFVAWGVVNGVLVMAAHAMTRAKWSLPYPLAWALTFLGVIVSRVLFVSSSFGNALITYSKMFQFSLLDFSDFWNQYGWELAYLFVGAGICFLAPNTRYFRDRFKPGRLSLSVTAFLILASVFSMNKVAEFLYFQF